MQHNNPNFPNQHDAEMQHQYYQAGGSEAPQGIAQQQRQGGNIYGANMGAYINNDMSSSMPSSSYQPHSTINVRNTFMPTNQQCDLHRQGERLQAQDLTHQNQPVQTMNSQMASLSVAANEPSYQRQPTPTMRHQGTQMAQSSGSGERGRSRNDGPATSVPVEYPSRNRRFEGVPEAPLDINSFDFDTDFFARSPDAAAIQSWAQQPRNNPAQQQHASSVPTTRVVQEQVQVQSRQPLQPLRQPNQFVASSSNQQMVPSNSNIYDQRQFSQQQQYVPRQQIPLPVAPPPLIRRPANRQMQQQRYQQPSQPMQHGNFGPPMPQGSASSWRQSVDNNAYRHDQFGQSSAQRPQNTDMASFRHQTVNQPMYNVHNRNQYPRSLPAPVHQSVVPSPFQSGNNRGYGEQYGQRQPTRYENPGILGWQSVPPAAAASNPIIQQISDEQEFINAEYMDPASARNSMLLPSSSFANNRQPTNQVPVDEQLTQYPTATSMARSPYALQQSQQYQPQVQSSQQPQFQARPANTVEIEQQSRSNASNQLNQSWEFQAQTATEMSMMPSYETGGNRNEQLSAHNQWTTSVANQNLVSTEARNATEQEEQFAQQASSIYQVPAEQQFASYATQHDPVPTAAMSEPIYEFNPDEESIDQLMVLMQAHHNQQTAEASASEMPPAVDNSQIYQSEELQTLAAASAPMYQFDLDGGFEMQQHEQFMFGEVLGEDEYPGQAALGESRNPLDQGTAEQQSSAWSNQASVNEKSPTLHSSNSSSPNGQVQLNSTPSSHQEVRPSLSPNAENSLAPAQELIEQPLSPASAFPNMMVTSSSPALSSDSSAFSLVHYVVNGKRSSSQHQPSRMATPSPSSHAEVDNDIVADQEMAERSLSPAKADQNENLTAKSPTWPTLSPDFSNDSPLGHLESEQQSSPQPQESDRTTPSTPTNAEVINDHESDQDMVEQPLSPASADQNIMTAKSPTWPTLSPDSSAAAQHGQIQMEERSSPQPQESGRTTPSIRDAENDFESDQEMMEQQLSPASADQNISSTAKSPTWPALSSDSSVSSPLDNIESEQRLSPQPQESDKTTPSSRGAENDLECDQEMVEQQLSPAAANLNSDPATSAMSPRLFSDSSASSSPLSQPQNDRQQSLSPVQSRRITPSSSPNAEVDDYFAAFVGEEMIEQSVFPQLLNQDLVTAPTPISPALSSDSSASSQNGQAEIEQPTPSPQQSGKTTPSTPLSREDESDLESDQEMVEQQLSPSSAHQSSTPDVTVKRSLFSDSSDSPSPLSEPDNEQPQSLSPQPTAAPLIPYPLSSASSASSPLGEEENERQSSPSQEKPGKTTPSTPSSREDESDLESDQDMVDQEFALASTHLDSEPAATVQRSLFSDSSDSSSPRSQSQNDQRQSQLPQLTAAPLISYALSSDFDVPSPFSQDKRDQQASPTSGNQDSTLTATVRRSLFSDSSASSSPLARIEHEEQASPTSGNQDSSLTTTVRRSLFSDSSASSSPLREIESAQQPSPSSIDQDLSPAKSVMRPKLFSDSSASSSPFSQQQNERQQSLSPQQSDRTTPSASLNFEVDYYPASDQEMMEQTPSPLANQGPVSPVALTPTSSIHGFEAQQDEIQFEELMELQEDDNNAAAMLSRSRSSTPSSSSSSDYANIFGSDNEMDEEPSPAVANRDSTPLTTARPNLFSESSDSSSPLGQDESEHQPSPSLTNQNSAPVSTATRRLFSDSSAFSPITQLQSKKDKPLVLSKHALAESFRASLAMSYLTTSASFQRRKNFKAQPNMSTEKMKLLATIKKLQKERAHVENLIEKSLPALALDDPVNIMSPRPSLHPVYSPTKRKKLLARLRLLQSIRFRLDTEVEAAAWLYHQDTFHVMMRQPQLNVVYPVPKPVSTTAQNAVILPLPAKPQPDPLTKWPASEEVEQALRTAAQQSALTPSTPTTSTQEEPKMSSQDIEYTNRRLMEILRMNRNTATASKSASIRRANRALFASPTNASFPPTQDTSPADPVDSTQSSECVTSPVSNQKDATVGLSTIFKTAAPVAPFRSSTSLNNSTTSDSSNASRFSKSNESSNSAVSTSTSSEERTQNIRLRTLTEEQRKELFSNYVVPERPEQMTSELDTSTSDDQSVKPAKPMAYVTAPSSVSSARTQKPKTPYDLYLEQDSSDEEGVAKHGILSLWTKASVPVRENRRTQKPKVTVPKEVNAADNVAPDAVDTKLKTANDIINYINDQDIYGPAVNNQILATVPPKKVEVALIARLLSVVDEDAYKIHIDKFATGEMSLFSPIHEDFPKPVAGCSIPVQHLLSRFKLYIESMRFLYTVDRLPEADFEFERTQSKSLFCIPPNREYDPSFYYEEFRTIGAVSKPLSRCTEFHKYEIYMLVDLHMLYAQKFLLSEEDYKAYVESHRIFLHKILKVVSEKPCNKRFQVLLEAARMLDTPPERIELAGILFEKEFKRMTAKMNEYIAMSDDIDMDRLDNNYHTFVMDAIFETDPRGCVEEPDFWYTAALGSHMNDIFYLLDAWNPLAEVIVESLKTELDTQRKQLYQCPNNFWPVLTNPNLWKQFLASPVVPPTHVNEKYTHVRNLVGAVKNGTYVPAKNRPFASSIPISVPLRREVNEYSLKLQLMKNVEYDDSSLLEHIKIVLNHFVNTLFPVIRNVRNLPFVDRNGRKLAPALNNAAISLLTDFVMHEFLREWEKYGKWIGKRFDNNIFPSERPGFQRVYKFFKQRSYHGLPTFLKRASVYLNDNGFDFSGYSLTGECVRYFKNSKVRLLPGYMVGKMIAYFSFPSVDEEESEDEMIMTTDDKPSLFADLKQTAEEYCAKQSADKQLDFGPMALAWPKDDQGFGRPIMPERPPAEVLTETDIPPMNFRTCDYKGKLIESPKKAASDKQRPEWKCQYVEEKSRLLIASKAQKMCEEVQKSRKRRLAERDTVSPSEGPAPKVSAPETNTTDLSDLNTSTPEAETDMNFVSPLAVPSSTEDSTSKMDKDAILRLMKIDEQLQKERMLLAKRETGVIYVISPSKVPPADKNKSTSKPAASEVSAPDNDAEPSSSDVATPSVSAADNNEAASSSNVSFEIHQYQAFLQQQKTLLEREKAQRYYMEREVLAAREGMSSEVTAPWYATGVKRQKVGHLNFYSTKRGWLETMNNSPSTAELQLLKEEDDTWNYLAPARESHRQALMFEASANSESDVEMADNTETHDKDEAETPAAPSSPATRASDDFNNSHVRKKEDRKNLIKRIASLSKAFSEPGIEDIVAAKAGTIPGSTVPKDLRPYTCPAPLFAVCTKKHSMIIEIPNNIRMKVQLSEIKNHPVWSALKEDDPESLHRPFIRCIQEQVGVTVENSFKYQYSATENMYRANKAIQTMHKIRENGLDKNDQLIYRADMETFVGILLPFDLREHVQFNSFCCINIEASSIKIQHSTLDLDYYAKRNASIFVPATRRRIPATFDFNNPSFMKNNKPSNWRAKSVL